MVVTSLGFAVRDNSLGIAQPPALEISLSKPFRRGKRAKYACKVHWSRLGQH
jgi:hypothetical protein